MCEITQSGWSVDAHRLSAVAPPVPAMTLAVIGVSSLVVSESSVISNSALTVTLTVAVSVTPPDVTV